MYGLLGAIAIMLPLLWLISTALKSPSENIFQSRLSCTQSTDCGELCQVWQLTPLVSTCSTVPFCGFHRYFESAVLRFTYPLARQSFPGRDWIFTLVSTIMIPFQIVMIPLYILTVQLGIRTLI